jgi:hypothetical protein
VVAVTTTGVEDVDLLVLGGGEVRTSPAMDRARAGRSVAVTELVVRGPVVVRRPDDSRSAGRRRP